MLISLALWYLFYPTPSYQKIDLAKENENKSGQASNAHKTKLNLKKVTPKPDDDHNIALDQCQKSSVSQETASELFDKILAQCKDSDGRHYDQKSIDIYNDFCRQSGFSTNRKITCMQKLLENRELLLRFIDRNLLEIDSFNWEFVKRILNTIGVNIDSRGGRILYELIFQSPDSDLKKRLTFMYMAAAVKKLDVPDGTLLLETARLEDVFNIEEIAGTLLEKRNE